MSSSLEEDEIDKNEELHPDINTSKFRRKNLSLLEEVDKRYKGKKISSKKIFNDYDSSELSEDDAGNALGGSSTDQSSDELDSEEEKALSGSAEDSNEEIGEDNKGKYIDGSEDSDEELSDNDDDNELNESVDISNPLLRDRRPNYGIKTISATNVVAEIEKGNCVKEQLKLWENLLEVRIKFNKSLANSNRLPQCDLFKNYKSDKEFKTHCLESKRKLANLLDNLLKLQSNLLSNFPETKDIKNVKKTKAGNDKDPNELNNPMDEEIPSDTEDEMNEKEEDDELEEESVESDNEKEIKQPARKKIKLSEFEKSIAKSHKAYTEYRNSVIQKWNDKTRIASGVINKGVNQPVVKQIEFALANKDKLLKKTWLKRSEYDIIGKSTISLDDNDGRRTQEYDTEIYDDDDFYHQLLRELIEYKSADITDPIQLSKQWIQLQSMRSKMKRKIDTRATKGRRIRYDVHQKLVNFMAPITTNDTWTDRAKDELFSSLFGKIKSVNKEKTS